MKLNWGHKLLISTILFMLFIIACVTYMIKQNVELVESDYYEQGIKYQEVIDQSKASNTIIAISIDSNATQDLTLHILDSSIQSASGSLNFYRPSDKSKDFSQTVSLKYGEMYSMPLKEFDRGVWKVTFIWDDVKGKHQLSKDIRL